MFIFNWKPWTLVHMSRLKYVELHGESKSASQFNRSLVLGGDIDKGVEGCRKRQRKSMCCLCKSHYWRVGWTNRWTSEGKREWRREWRNRLGNRWRARLIVYWTWISALQQNRQTVFTFYSRCKCLQNTYCVFVCLDSYLHWDWWSPNLFELLKSTILHAALLGNTSKQIDLYQVEMMICFFISTPKNIHAIRSKAFLFELYLTVF